MTIPLTVALTTFNRAHYLKESLSAILNQTYHDFELLVLDNGSSDDTPYIVLGYKDDRLRYIRNAPGQTSGFNSLSAQWIARSEWLLITHDDDIMEPDMLERQMELIRERPDLTAIWTNKSIINSDGAVIHPWITPPGPTRIFERGEYIARATEERLWYPASSMIFKPHLVSTIKLLHAYRGSKSLTARPVTLGAGDHIRTAMMNVKGPVAFLNAPLLRYRQSTVQESHHVHLSQAALCTFESLRRLVRKTPYRQEYEPMFDAQIARFKAQDIVIQLEKAMIDASALKRLSGLLERAIKGCAVNARVGHPVLPLILLLLQAGQGTVVGKAASVALDQMEKPGLETTQAVKLLYEWAKAWRTGVNIFSRLKGANIVILGSAFVAALLLRDAREAGVNVVCCVDSNVTRQDRAWFGMQIVPPSWLAAREERIDLIILSSERDHEDKLGAFIKRFDATTPIQSWKDLVKALA